MDELIDPQYCKHICQCTNKLLTISSKIRGTCASCMLGNCKGLPVIKYD